jgi:tRNA U34 5-methylaminomethyl-2-thiouridine-forming methyltransferase MnmC
MTDAPDEQAALEIPSAAIVVRKKRLDVIGFSLLRRTEQAKKVGERTEYLRAEAVAISSGRSP